MKTSTPNLPRLAASALCVLAALPAFAVALTDAEIQNVFGQGFSGTAASRQLPQFLFSVVTNTSHALVSLNATSSSPAQVGWMGTGIGTAMANSDFLITWPTVSGSQVSWTLSHRGAAAEVQPTVVSTDAATSTSALYTLLPQLSTTDANSAFSVVTYLRPLAFPSALSATAYKPLTRAQTSFIYASSTVKPASAAEDATLTQHNQAHSDTSLDLSTAFAVAATPGAATPTGSGSSLPSAAPEAGASSSGGFNMRDKRLIAHATVGSIALLVLVPFAILIARFFRTGRWFPAHAGLQIVAAALIVACFALGYTQTSGSHFDDTHNILGLVLFIIVIVNVIIGAVAHRIPVDRAAVSHTSLPTLATKSPVRLFHILTGIAIPVLGFVQVHEGFELWEEQNSLGRTVPKAVMIVFWILAGVFAAAYILGWVLEALGRKKRRASPPLSSPRKVESTEHY